MSEREARYQHAMSQGHSAAWDQEWEKAAGFYRSALVDEPDDPKALNSLALALYELQDYKTSLHFYARVVEKSPKDPVPLEKAAILCEILKNTKVGAELAVRAAELYLRSGDIEKAIENWSRALGMNPEHLVAHSRLALVYERVKRIPQAVRAYLHIASLMQHNGERDKAVQAVNRALKLSPNSEEAQQALVMLRENRLLPKPTRPQEGMRPTREPGAVMLDVSKDESGSELTPVAEAEQKAISALAELFFEQSNEEDEKRSPPGSFDSIVKGTGPLFPKNVDKTQLMLHLGQVVDYLTRGENESAATELERVTEIGLHHPAAFYRLGMLRLDSDRLESGIRNFKRAVSHPDYALGSRLLMAVAYKLRGKVHEASLEYLKALSLADAEVVLPIHADGLRQLYEPLIEAHMQNVDVDQCAEICDTIAEILDRPKWRQYLRKIRGELVPNGDGPPVPLADVLTEASSSQVVVAMSHVRQLAREGRRHAAFEEALFALQDGPTYLPLHIAIGDLLVSGNQIQAAIEKFIVVANSYSVRGEAGRAIEMLRRVIEMSPMDMDTRNRLIDQLISRGQSEDAVTEIIKMAEVQYSLAELLAARKTYVRALRYAHQSGLDKSWRVQILHRTADIDVQSLNWRQALTMYEQICALQPNDLDANRKIIDLNLRLGERKQALAKVGGFVRKLNAGGRQEDSIRFLERLSEDWPEQFMIIRILADQYQAADRVEDAVDRLDALWGTLLDAGDRDGAVEILKKIIDLNPSDVGKYHHLLSRI